MHARVWIAMPKANIHHRDTLEQIYAPSAFASDAAQNGGAADQFVRGVRILCAPDNAGAFEFERTTQQVGETSSAAFLAPYRREDTLATPRHGSSAATPDPRGGYQTFLDDIVAAAQHFGFKPEESLGRDEPRLRGLRQ